MDWLDAFNNMRKISGMSLDEISEISGIPKGTLSKITSGITKNPGLETMRILVNTLGFTLNDLDEGGGKKITAENSLREDERELLQKYNTLDEIDKGRILERIDSFLEAEKYKKARVSFSCVNGIIKVFLD